MRTLYSYFRSSAAYRVRIALALKGLEYDVVPIHLLKDGGEQLGAAYLARNPEGLVPAFSENDHTLSQSLAIMEYLDEVYPEVALLPAAPADRARVRALALLVACDIHPLNNLRVLRWLAHNLKVDQAARDDWYRHWILTGFQALETRLQAVQTGLFCQGDQPGLADCCLVPQVYNAKRYHIDVSAWPTIARIATHCNTLSAFQAAHPDQQPDAA
ncbi:maleylacetoacetate isomerase [Castellaniella sp.]|uniref:maleylacetoacetate isomerase n=1 Tax=Castellaniella sp. TaxID=1955812 RepID=UPI002AFF2993|nr:maleylacetoacetate isomerase [Castellaniella sp.]